MDFIYEFGFIMPFPIKTRRENNITVKVNVISPVKKRY